MVFWKPKKMTADKKPLTVDEVQSLLDSIRSEVNHMTQVNSPNASTEDPLVAALKTNINGALGLKENDSIFDGDTVNEDTANKVLTTFNNDIKNSPIKFRWRAWGIVKLLNQLYTLLFGTINDQAKQRRRELFSQVGLLQQKANLQYGETITWGIQEFRSFGIQKHDGQNDADLTDDLNILWNDQKQPKELLSKTQFDATLRTANEDVARTIIVGKQPSGVGLDVHALGADAEITIDSSTQQNDTLTLSVTCQRPYGIKQTHDERTYIDHLDQDHQLDRHAGKDSPNNAKGIYTLTTTHQVTLTKRDKKIHMQSKLQRVAFQNHYDDLPLAKQISENASLASAIMNRTEILGVTAKIIPDEQKHAKKQNQENKLTAEEIKYLASVDSIATPPPTQTDASQNANPSPSEDGSDNQDTLPKKEPTEPPQPTQPASTNPSDASDQREHQQTPELSTIVNAWQAAAEQFANQETTDDTMPENDSTQQDPARAAWVNAKPDAERLTEAQDQENINASSIQRNNSTPPSEPAHPDSKPGQSPKKPKKKKKKENHQKGTTKQSNKKRKTRNAIIEEPVDPKSQFGRLQQQFSKGTKGLRTYSWESLIDELSTRVYDLKKGAYILTEKDASLAKKVKDFIVDMKNSEPVSIMSDGPVEEIKTQSILGLENADQAGYSSIQIKEFPGTRRIEDPYLVVDQEGHIACHTPCHFDYYLMEVISGDVRYYTMSNDGHVQVSDEPPQKDDGSQPVFSLDIIAKTQFKANNHAQGFKAEALQSTVKDWDKLTNHAQNDPCYKQAPQGTSPAQAAIETVKQGQIDGFCDQVAEKARDAIKRALTKQPIKSRLTKQMPKRLRSKSKPIQVQAQQADLLPTLQANITQNTEINLFADDEDQIDEVRKYIKKRIQEACAETKFNSAEELATHIAHQLIGTIAPAVQDDSPLIQYVDKACKSVRDQTWNFDESIKQTILGQHTMTVLAQDAPLPASTNDGSTKQHTVIATGVQLPGSYPDDSEKKTQTPGNNLNQS